ncbi:MAG: helix-hairpin-helix domain-containing protein [Lysobacteraceae bacterium]
MHLIRRCKAAWLVLLLACTPLWAADTVDINHADALELAAKLSGVGMTRAEAIISSRETLGPFVHPDELVRVKGIGPATLEKNRDRIVVGSPDHDVLR